MKKVLFCLGLFMGLAGQGQMPDSPDSTFYSAGKQYFIGGRQLYAPSALLLYGLLRPYVRDIQRLDLQTKNEITEDHSYFRVHVDDYLQFVPSLSMYALDGLGVRTEHPFRQQLVREAVSFGIMSLVLYPLKKFDGELRPDGSADNSFPSGHTANAFRAAEMLHQELKSSHPFWGSAGYAIAAATGALRLYNNRHWLSDVVAGAGLGMLSTKCAYWLLQQKTRKRERFVL